MLFKKVILLIVILVTILPADENGRYWIYLKDKTPFSQNNLPGLSDIPISERAIKRRQLRGDGTIFDHTDLPLSRNYIVKLENMGIEIYRQSRWLNAVSCYLNGVDKEVVMNLSFVLKVEPVRSSKIKPVEMSEEQIFHKPVSEDYGPSFNQNDMIGIPFAHEIGSHGEDVLIALFDGGFILDHEALQHIEVVAAWDFIYDDDNVADDDEDVPGQQNHGTLVLSVLAGYSPGHIIGPAYASQFLLAKTDHLTLETKQDEDNWVAAAEWAEGLGADVISSSVGYDYDLDYTYEDMDGNTTPITIGADVAASRGMVVVNSAGNSGSSLWYYITAPADGDSVFTIGAVNSQGVPAGFSSNGPTYDGRTKPNVVAQGEGAYFASPNGSFLYGNGTSFSSPIIAGMMACLWQANPDTNNMALINAVQESGSIAAAPDNKIGYGIPDFMAALNILTVIENDEEAVLTQINLYPNPFTSYFVLNVRSEMNANARLAVVDMTGRTVFENEYLVSRGMNYIRVSALDNIPAGIYFLRMESAKSVITTKLIRQ